MAKVCGILVAAGALLLAGCGRPDGADPDRLDLLFLRSPRGVAVIEAGAAAPAFKGDAAVPSQDWSTVVRSVPEQRKTRVVALDPGTGIERWERAVPGDLAVKVVSGDGNLAALGPAGEPPYRAGRTQTKLVIAGGRDLESRTYALDGNYEPEAFSTDGKSLFVIRYLPARAPTSYQVRRLDLTSGRVVGVYTPDADLQEAMGGTARIQASSPDGRRLYTLYTLGRGAERYAFIHVLSLDELWAHCIDLPVGFAEFAEAATALTVSPDGTRLYATNSATGTLTEIDTTMLEVLRTTTIDLDEGKIAHALHGSKSALYLASGRRVLEIDVDALKERRSWRMEDQVTGLQVTGDAKRLYVGLRNQVAILDSVTGARLDVIDPPGVKRIKSFGPVLRSVDEERKKIVCAC